MAPAATVGPEMIMRRIARIVGCATIMACAVLAGTQALGQESGGPSQTTDVDLGRVNQVVQGSAPTAVRNELTAATTRPDRAPGHVEARVRAAGVRQTASAMNGVAFNEANLAQLK